MVDCGTHKVLRYDPVKRSSKLQEEMITKANAQQRAGRAGRVAEGQCFRLYEKDEFEMMQASVAKHKPQAWLRPFSRILRESSSRST